VTDDLRPAAEEAQGGSSGVDPSTQDPSAHSPEPPARYAARPVPSRGRWAGTPTEPARYELLKRVAAGAEGVLWRARYVGRDGAADEIVAVKVYERPATADPSWPDDGTWLQVQDQHRLLQMAGHTAHVVRVQEVLRAVVTVDGHRAPGENPVVVMDWIEGGPPAPRQGDRLVPLAERLRWIRQLADAVDVLHAVSRRGDVPLVHSDIKPSNCLIDPVQGLVLVDTGAVQRVGGVGDHRGLRSEQYAAAEVLGAPGRARTEAADLYSVGAVAYFLLTGSVPARADDPDQAAKLAAGIDGWSELPKRRRRTVAAHLLAMLASEPADRPTGGATAWARTLTRLATPRRWPLAAGTGSVAVAAVVALLVWNSPAVEERTLAPFEGEVLYTAFPALTRDWPELETNGYTTTWTGAGYRLHLVSLGEYETVPAPSTPAPSDQVVSATGTRVSGQGAWGVWCRGTDETGSDRYEFQLSHAGAVRIVMPDATATDWTYVEGLDTTRPHTLTGRCADVPDAPVELTLAVDGVVQQEHRPAAILGPGYSGIEGMTFSDVPGPTLTADFERFEVRRGI
jgi:hypothetical protein